jgi:hypothetical protein
MQNEEGEDVTVEAFFKRFPQNEEKTLSNYTGEWSLGMDLTSFGGKIPTGSIEDFFLQHVVKSLKVDDKPVKFGNRGVWASLPDLVDDHDEENFDGLGKRLVRLGVKHNVRVARHPDYRMIFGKYLPEDVEDKNPTEPSSTNGRSSGSAAEKNNPVTPLS